MKSMSCLLTDITLKYCAAAVNSWERSTEKILNCVDSGTRLRSFQESSENTNRRFFGRRTVFINVKIIFEQDLFLYKQQKTLFPHLPCCTMSVIMKAHATQSSRWRCCSVYVCTECLEGMTTWFWQKVSAALNQCSRSLSWFLWTS